MSIELINISTKQWPVTLAQFKEAHPHTHLPDDPEILAQIDWQDFGYAILTEDEKPAFDPLTQALEPEIKVKNKAHKKGWKVVSLPAQDAAVALARATHELVVKIDADVDAIYAAALGNRATEYQEAEAHARAYRAAEYSGEVPSYVSAWASATGNDAEWAAKDIIATADAWRLAQSMIRVNRLALKQRAKGAETAADISAIDTEWQAFVAAIKSQLGVA